MDDGTWQALAEAQQGLATRAQLREHGVTAEQLRWRLGRSWTLVLPRVVDVRGGRLTPERRLVASTLEAGPSSVISGHHACLWHGLENAHGHTKVLTLVGSKQASRTTGFVRVVRTHRPVVTPVVRGLLRVAPPARAVVDAARTTRTPREAAAIVIEAVQRELVSVAQLVHEVEAGARRGSASVRRAVELAAAGAWSAPEAELLDLCDSSPRLPHVWPNPWLRRPGGTALISPDGWLDDVGLALMVHSKRHHVREAEWRSTVERDGELQEVGVVVLGFTPSSIASEPGAVLARIERTYARLVASGHRRADVVMTPRGQGLGR
ncbi:MAG TPA: hypothetical protein VHO27_14855 [Angustibacter sp.]|nr:hypothetical protein [Angustibacter sp.]